MKRVFLHLKHGTIYECNQDFSKNVIFYIELLRLGGRRLLKKTVSGIMLTLLILGLLTLAFNIQQARSWTGTVYIRANGSIDPSTAPIQRDGETYILTDNIVSVGAAIIIERNNIIFDGNGHWIEGNGTEEGIFLASSNVTVRNANVMNFSRGISIFNCLLNTVVSNNVSRNKVGIEILYASNNSVFGNNLMENSRWGIDIYLSSYNEVYGNLITNNSGGVSIYAASSYNSVFRNTIMNNSVALYIADAASDNRIFENDLIYNSYGCSIASIGGEINNKFYHNNFILNDVQAQVYQTNVFDDGYPSGGNYWSDYAGADLFRGPYQNETGSDGIGDIAYYVIDESNIDNYPLTKPYAGPHDVGLRASFSRTIIPEGFNTTLTTNVTIINYGFQTETFNFTFQTPALNQSQELTLESRNSTTITFTWNTTCFTKGNYSIRARAEPVLGESDVSDNSFELWVIVTIPGDTNGDATVNFLDAILLGAAFGSEPNDDNWNPNADINNDNTINFLDAIILGAHFGQSWT